MKTNLETNTMYCFLKKMTYFISLYDKFCYLDISIYKQCMSFLWSAKNFNEKEGWGVMLFEVILHKKLVDYTMEINTCI
jgi:hypothetical protein